MIEPIKLLLTSDKIQWEAPLANLILFSAEFKCSIPYKFYGQEEICRYTKYFDGIALYVTPVFSEDKLVCLKSFFEHGEDLKQYRHLLNGVIAEFGQPIYAAKELLGDYGLTRYPHNIWVCNDSILEVGIRDQQKLVPFGNIMLTLKRKYKAIYTDAYLREIGWRPPPNLK